MCEDCLMDATGGVEPRTTMAMRYAAALVLAVYATPDGGVGGALHVELDDMNLEDYWFTAVARFNLIGYVVSDFPEDLDLYLLTFDTLAQLTEAERATVCYRRAGLFDDDSPGPGRGVGQPVLEFIDSHTDIELTDWQRSYIEAVYASGGRPPFVPTMLEGPVEG